MKNTCKSFRFRFRFISTALGLAGALLAGNANAANLWFDVNGTTAGSGVTAGNTYSWEGSFWATTSLGTVTTTTWTEGNFPEFSAGSDATVSYTINAGSPHHIIGALVRTAPSTTNVFLTGADLTIDTAQQGFFSSGLLHIANKLTGVGGVIAQSGQIFLDGPNDYSAGTTPGAGLINFNSSSSFGTGNLIISTSGSALIPEGTSAINIPNNWTISINGGSGLNCVGLAAGITYSGNMNLGANTFNIGCGGGSGVLDVFSGVISGTGGIGRQSSTSHGTIKFSGANTYTGKTLLQSSVTSVGSLNSVATPAQQPSSNLGVPSSVANGTLGFGATTFTGTLVYTGPGETTDRVIDLAGTTGGATIEADGTGPVAFTSPNTATGSGAKTLTLQGTSTAANTIAGSIVDSSAGATSVRKAQAGTWVLSGTNAYTGGTTNAAGTFQIGATGKLTGNVTITGGTFEIVSGGLLAGNVTNNATGGVLKLDGPSSLSPGTVLNLVSTGTQPSVNLSFSGTQTINALLIDGSTAATGTYGSLSSTAANKLAIFSGNGIINVLAAPVIVQQPQSLVVYPGAVNATFSVAVTGDPSFTYQWSFDSAPISGATDSTYVIGSVNATNAGTYSVHIVNNSGSTNSAGATLTILATNFYVNTILGDGPISYWRLDEGSGTVAYDGVGGNNGQYVNATLGQPGFSLTDTDTCVGLPANISARGYVQVTNFTPFNFNGAFPFTFEGWAYFTNLTGNQRLFSTLTLTAPAGYGFAVVGNNVLRFTTGNVQDADLTIGTPLVTGVWYYLAVTSDGSSYYYYVNGNPVGSVVINGVGSGVSAPLQMGANPPSYSTAEQVNGRLDEMAVYNTTLSPGTILNHYNARYGTLSAPVVSTPVASPPTNYVSLSTIIQAVAAGQALSYQWYQGATLLAGQTGDTLTLSSLQSTNAGSYDVVVSNPAGTNTSPSVVITVLPIPTNAAQLNLTSDLVLHLPFDGGYGDISGHNNNGTNVGATTFVSPGAVGASALHYSTASGSTNYVTLGVRPDLQFGSSVDFSVSYWIRQPMGSTFTNLPFFTDAIGSTASGGFAFAPYATATSAGGWMWTVGTVTSPNAATHFPDSDLINDGNWHNLVHVAQRSANMTTYLDGVQVDSQSIVVVGNINTANAATIGQDPTGAYPVMASADIDDLGVWTRTLTPLEVSGLYLAGASNGVSFAVAPVAPLTITSISGTTLSYSGGTGPTYVLLGSSNVAAPVSGWTHVQTNSTSPGSFTIPAVGSGAAQFYLIKNQ